MKRILLLLLMTSSLAFAQEPRGYVGFGLSLVLPFVQAGVAVGDGLEVRGAVESIIFVTRVQADLLYRIPGEEDWTFYVGGGGDYLIGAIPLFEPADALALHATAGAEYRTGAIGLFGEVQPSVVVAGGEGFGLFVRAGVNFTF